MPSFKPAPDRQLGDAWLRWNGRLKSFEKNSDSQKRIYIGLTFFFLLTAALGLYAVYYLIEPRLRILNSKLPDAVAALLIAAVGVGFLFFIVSVLALWTRIKLICKPFDKSIPLRFIAPYVFKLGRLAGRSKDQLFNSFIKVHNCWIRLNAEKTKAQGILVLLPRCLQKQLLDQIGQFLSPRRIPVFVVSGGEMARRIVRERKPKVVIGVACERDLFSAIMDLCANVRIIGIPNYRPEGPCKNTRIDCMEFEQTVLSFLNG
jgi:hypothetical protein